MTAAITCFQTRSGYNIEAFVRKVHNGRIHPPLAPRFTDVLSIGIGGSALGPQFVDEALAADFPPMDIHFIDNTDPAGIDRILNRMKDRLCSTLVIVTSKSGGTPETRNGMLEDQFVASIEIEPDATSGDFLLQNCQTSGSQSSRHRFAE